MSAENVTTVVDADETDGGQTEGLMRRLLREPLAVVSAAYLVALIVLAVGAPVFAPNAPNYVDLEQTNTAPFTGEYLLGGDSQGRDIFSRLLFATRGTLLACVVVLTVSVVVGVTGGLLAGYIRGKVEMIAGWISDAIMALPGIVLLIALYTVIGPSILTAMAVFGVLIAPAQFRLVRAVVAGVRSELYVDAAKVSGLSDTRIIFRHVLGAVRSAVIIQSGFILAAGIGIQAGLEFLGLGDPRAPSWGGILQQSLETIYINRGAVLVPALLVTVTTLAFVLLGNALRDTLQRTTSARPVRAGVIAERRAEAAGGDAAASQDEDALLSVRGLRIGYPSGRDGITDVVRGVDLDVHRGKIHGLVGESGSGKSQTAFAILGLLPKDSITLGGAVYFDGADLIGDASAAKGARGRRMAYVPQEPMSNLDPTITIGRQLMVGLRSVREMPKAEAREHLLTLLRRVGIGDAETVFDVYPHQISGGMAQRVLITGAIAGDPELIVADEPTTALDVTVQAEVLELLRELRDERDLGMILVTHDLAVVADICDEVSVMREGRIVEHREVHDLFGDPRHEYTRELLAGTLDTQEVR